MNSLSERVEDLESELEDATERLERATLLLGTTQELFGSIVRYKEHEGGHLMAGIDALLQEAWAKKLIHARDAAERLRGEFDPKVTTYIDDKTAHTIKALKTCLAVVRDQAAWLEGQCVSAGCASMTEELLADQKALRHEAGEAGKLAEKLLIATGHM